MRIKNHTPKPYYTANNTESQQHFSSEQIQVDVDLIDNRPGNRTGGCFPAVFTIYDKIEENE